MGEFRFTANAPATKVEVRARFRNTDGVFGPWLGDNIITASAVVEYDTITGTPTTIHDINPGEGTKLDGIEPGATNGAVIGGNVKNPDGTLYVPVTTDYEDIRHDVEQDIASALNTAKAGLDADIQSVRNDVTAARGEITQAKTDLQTGITDAKKAGTDAAATAQGIRTDLTAEVDRAKNEEGAIRTTVASVKQTADKATTDISDEINARTNADSALANRASTVEAQLRGDQDSTLAARIRDEATARTNAVDAVANRTSTVEAKLNGDQDSKLAANIRDEATARANADDALSGRVSTTEAKLNGDQDSTLAARIRDEATARTNADGALATRATNIEASFGRTRESILPTNFAGELTEWGRDGSGAFYFEDHSASSGWDRNPTVLMVWNGEADQYIYPKLDNGAQLLPVSPGQKLRLTASLAMWGGTGRNIYVYFDLHGRDRGYLGNGGVSSMTPAGLLNARDVGVDNQWHDFVTEITVPQSAAFVRPILHVSGGGGFIRSFRVEYTNAVAATDARLSDEATARSDADSALSGRVSTTEAQMRGDQDSTLAARIRDEASARADAVSAVAGRTSTLETSSFGAGNLLSNTDFLTLDGWTMTNNPSGSSTMSINAAGDAWHPPAENTISLFQWAPVGGSQYVEAQSARFAVAAGEWLQCYVYAASHRSDTWCSVFFFDANGNWNGYAGDFGGARRDAGGRNIGDFDRIGTPSFRVPEGTASACLAIRKQDTLPGNGDSYSWFLRPYVGYAKQGQTQFNPYAPGSAKVTIAATNTKISDEATARSNADSALSGRVSTTEAKLNGDQDSTLAARIRDEATARTDAVSAVAGRTSTLETGFSRIPEIWTVKAAGNGAQRPTNFGDVGVFNPAGTQWGGYRRSYTVTVFAMGANTVEACVAFDVYGNGEAQYNAGGPGANNAAAMAAYLNNIPNGKTVVVFTADEPANNRGNTGLMEAMQRCGAGERFEAGDFRLHSAYILIGRAGVARGGGMEYYAGLNNTDPGSWLEVPFTLVNGRAVSGAQAGIASTSTKISDEATARSNADSALSGRVSTTEAKLNGDQDSTLAARIRDEATARTNADGALATRANYLEANAGLAAGILNANPNFSAWPDGQQLPSYWHWWNADGLEAISRPASETWPGWAARINARAGQNLGFAQMDGAGPDVSPGWYVMEADVRLETGSWEGSGLTIQGVYNLNFAAEADTAGNVHATALGRRRFTKLVFVSGGLRNWHAMTNWNAWTMAAKQMVWYRCAIRPATDAEILAQKVNNDVNGAGGAIARIGNEETARANADSALAGRTTVVEAQVSNDSNNLLRNSIFNAPGWTTSSTGIPPLWGGWSQDNGAYIGANGRRSRYGAVAPLQIDRNGNNNGVSQNLGTLPAGWYVLEADLDFEDGNHTGCGVHINFNNGYLRNFHFGSEADTNGGVVSGGLNVARSFSTMFYNGAVGNNVMFYLMAGWEGFATGQGFLRTIWHKAVVRPATDAEIKAQKVSDANITARVSSVESTTATVNGKTQAYFSKSVSVPGAQAFITAQALNDAGQATSDVAIGGNSIALYNTADGTARRAMYLAAGNATFDGFITARSGIRIGDGQWSIAVSPKDFSVSNGTYVSYGYDLGRVPTVTFGPAPIALNAGEVYRAYAANSTSTGFTAVCEIVSAPTSSNQSVGPGYSVNGAQAFEVGKGTADATNGVYNFSVSGTVQAYAYSDGGGINCVHVDAWLTDMLQAGDAQVGDEIMVLTEHRETWEPARVERSYVAESHCVRITTVSGIKLTLSEDTPVTLQDGREIWVREIVGEEVAVLDHGAFRWEEVIGLEEIGQQPVARLSVWSGTYAAGDEKGRMIFTHNLPNKP
ncbi:hypothetical protein CP552_00210 [Sphingomonas melonis]|nr:hypothetical protein CP552_00210 [Sphingomonas melonis]